MLSVVTDPQASYAATLFSDLRDVDKPHAVCVLKCRFVFSQVARAWVLNPIPPNFAEIDVWDSLSARQVSDLVPEKTQAELLLQGTVKPLAEVRLETRTESTSLAKTGHLSPAPILYWQSQWTPRPTLPLNKTHFMVSPSLARHFLPWENTTCLQFEGLFVSADIPRKSIFRTENLLAYGRLISENHRSDIPFACDTLMINTDTADIDALWRARFPWDFMKERLGHLTLRLCVD